MWYNAVIYKTLSETSIHPSPPSSVKVECVPWNRSAPSTCSYVCLLHLYHSPSRVCVHCSSLLLVLLLLLAFCLPPDLRRRRRRRRQPQRTRQRPQSQHTWILSLLIVASFQRQRACVQLLCVCVLFSTSPPIAAAATVCFPCVAPRKVERRIHSSDVVPIRPTTVPSIFCKTCPAPVSHLLQLLVHSFDHFSET